MKIPGGKAWGWWRKHPKTVVNVIVTPSVEGREEMKVGTVVWVSLGSGDEDLLGLFVKEAGDKDVIQVGKSLESLAYREPEDRDTAGSGRTWWKVK